MIIKTLRKFLRILTHIMPSKFTLALVLMVSLGFTEGVSLLLLVPLLQLVGLDAQQGSLGRIAEFVSSVFKIIGLRPTLIAVLGFYVSIIVVHSLLKRWETSVSLSLEYEFVLRLREKLYRAIANTDWLFFARSRVSDFTHALTIEMERIGAATYYLLSLLATTIVALAYILMAVKLSAMMTGLVFFCGIGLLFLLKSKTRIAHETGEGLSEAMSGLYNSISEHLNGMKTAKSYGAEERHVEIFKELAEQIRHMYSHAVQNQAEVNYWFNIGSVIILSIILFVSVRVLSIPTAGLLLLLFLFARVMPKLSTIQQSFQSLTNMLPSFSRVVELQIHCEEASETETKPYQKIEIGNAIKFNKVSFSYNGTSPVIRDFDLLIQTGQTIAMVGPSGSGKTTVADLLMGLIRPEKGTILLDGKEFSARNMKAWREQIGYVPQDTFLFHDTLRANLLWAKRDASEGEMNQALKLAAAMEFVSRLPKGIGTDLGDRGVLISGGERQRIALARALLRKPSLLILDEATSSLDSENEKRIQSAIEDLHGQMTILLISHRLSTIRSADVIHVLDEGRLLESGTWDELVAKNGRFKNLCDAQGIN